MNSTTTNELRNDTILQQRLNFSEQLISKFSHDFRGSLSNVITISNFMLHEKYTGQIDNQVKDLLIAINKELKWLLDYSDTLYNWIQLDKEVVIEPKSTNLHAICWDVKTLFDNRFDMQTITCEVRIDDALFVSVDKALFTMALNCIVSNALKYMHSGGNITFNATHNSTQTLLTITDTGSGMSHEAISLFNNDYNTTLLPYAGGDDSSGLELRISKKIIESHGFESNISTELHKGTILTIKIPNSFVTK